MSAPGSEVTAVVADIRRKLAEQHGISPDAIGVRHYRHDNGDEHYEVTYRLPPAAEQVEITISPYQLA